MRPLLLLLFALSQDPTPTSGKGKGQPPQEKRATNQAPPAPYQRGTDTAPVFIQRSTRDSAFEAQQNAADREEKASSDGWMIGFTGGLLLVAFLQIALWGWQFVATFRPKLVVRQVSRVRENDEYAVEFTVANQGGSLATIIESRADLLVVPAEKGVEARPLRDASPALKQQSLRAGASTVVRWAEPITIDMRFEQEEMHGAEQARLFFLGDITYRDRIRTVRRMGFYLIYERESKRFRTVEDPDFEYAD